MTGVRPWTPDPDHAGVLLHEAAGRLTNPPRWGSCSSRSGGSWVMPGSAAYGRSATRPGAVSPWRPSVCG